MNREEMLTKAARAMFETHDPSHAKRHPPGRWSQMALLMYRSRFITGLNVVEDDIRADERARIAAQLRNVTSNGTAVDPAVSAQIFAEMIERGLPG